MKNKGYKIFISGDEVREGDIFIYQGSIKPHERGYHYALNMEDTFRYAGSLTPDPFTLCEVTAMGKIASFDDEYYGYYDICVTDRLKVDKIMSRKDIIDYALQLQGHRLKRFIQTCKLTPEECELFYGKDPEIDKHIDYYQFGKRDVFELPSQKNK